MRSIKRQCQRLGASLLALALTAASPAVSAQAAGHEDLAPGTYEVQADFTAFISAMGGVEFGAEVYDSTYVTVNEDLSAQVTVGFTKGVVTIYGLTCDVFVDPNYSLQYLSNGSWTDITDYTVSGNTALDPENTPINYVDSITFDLDHVSDSYELGVYINSNVMGVQFGSGSSYYAGLSIDWDSAQVSEGYTPSNGNSANVTYTVPSTTGEYEVSIPSLITVDSQTKTGEYEVQAVRVDLSDGAYLKVSADTSGVLRSESNTVDFRNELDGEILREAGDFLAGAVNVTDTTAVAGTYVGTLNFTIEIDS